MFCDVYGSACQYLEEWRRAVDHILCNSFAHINRRVDDAVGCNCGHSFLRSQLQTHEEQLQTDAL